MEASRFQKVVFNDVAAGHQETFGHFGCVPEDESSGYGGVASPGCLSSSTSQVGKWTHQKLLQLLVTMVLCCHGVAMGTVWSLQEDIQMFLVWLTRMHLERKIVINVCVCADDKNVVPGGGASYLTATPM